MEFQSNRYNKKLWDKHIKSRKTKLIYALKQNLIRKLSKKELIEIGRLIYDQMTESIFLTQESIKDLFIHMKQPSRIKSY